MEIYQAKPLSCSINLINDKENIIGLSLTTTKIVTKWGSIFGTDLNFYRFFDVIRKPKLFVHESSFYKSIMSIYKICEFVYFTYAICQGLK